MRIAILSPWGASGGYSGPLTFLNRLFAAVRCLDPNIRISLIARDRGGEVAPSWANETIFAGGVYDSFRARNQGAWSLAARSALRHLEPRPEVVHLHGTYLLSQIALVGSGLMTRAALLPVLADGDLGGDVKSTPKAFAKELASRHVVRRAALGIALSESIAAELSSWGMEPSRIFHLGNVVSSDHFNITRSHVSKPLTLGFVGKLGSIKRPHIILETLSVLRRRGIDARALFVGPFENVSYKDMFYGLIDKLDVQHKVVLTGMVSDTAPYFEEMDIFVLPSSSEGLPGALTEAFASSLVCLATDVGGMGAAIRKAGAGEVVEPIADKIADATEWLLKDPAAMLVAGRSAREFARANYAPDAVAGTYLSRLQSLRA